MVDVQESLDRMVSFYNLKCIRLRVPLRFEDDDLERAFEQFLRQKAGAYLVAVLLMVSFASFLAVAALWEDLRSIAHQTGEPSNFFVAIPVTCMFLVSLAAFACSWVKPTLLTEVVRLVFFILHLSRFALFCRPVAMAIYDTHWQYSAFSQFQPHNIWLVLVCMLVTTLSCQSLCFRCAHSWIICISSVTLISAQSFALAQGRQALHQNIMMAVLYSVQALFCFYGHVTMEIAERRVFLNLHNAEQVIVEERVKRYLAERRASDGQIIPATQCEECASSPKAKQASEASFVSSRIFQALHTGVEPAEAKAFLVNALRTLGEEEHWLIQSEDLELCPNRNVGTGGFSSVVAGTWMSSQVAVKVPKLPERGECHPLALEMRHLRKLRHPCIVSFLGVCLVDDSSEALLVEELVNGDNLDKFMAMLGVFANSCVQFRQHLLLDVSAALRYLHSQPVAIVHGDLKPANVLIERHSLHAKLTDFGLARRATVDKMPGGTYNWLEPHLRERGQRDRVHCSADIWAFGCIAFFACTGVGPWRGTRVSGSSAMERFSTTVFKLWHGETHENSGVATQTSKKKTPYLHCSEDFDLLSAVCCKCMALDVRQRPTATDVNLEIKSWQTNRLGDRGLSNIGDALCQSVGCSSRGSGSHSQDSALNEQLAIVRAKQPSMLAAQRMNLPADLMNQITEVLRQQLERLRALPALNSYREAASSIIQVLLASVIKQDMFQQHAISL